MKNVAALVLLLLAATPAHAFLRSTAQPFIPQPPNCSPVPTPDGCIITNGSGTNTAIFTDSASNTWQFKSDNNLYINGSQFSAGPNKVQMGSGHKAFIGTLCNIPASTQFWQDGTDSGDKQAIDPNTLYADPFSITSHTFGSLDKANGLTGDANYVDGATITIGALPNGLTAFNTSGVIYRKNQTWNVNDTAIFVCSTAETNAILTYDTGAGNANLAQNNTFNLGKSEWEWVHGGGVRAFHLQGSVTLNGTANPSRPNINDNDFGIDSVNGPAFTASMAAAVMTVSAITQGNISIGTLIHGVGVAAGTTVTGFGTGSGGTGTYNISVSQTIASEQMGGTDGSITLNNIWAEHNGASAATTGSAGATHNVYIGSGCETLNISGGGYYAESPQGDTSHAGYQLKSRCASGGLITGATFAGVSRFLGNTDPMASAVMDFPCGGGPLTISGNTIELGQNDNQGGGHGLIKYGDGRSGDCSTNWFTNTINITGNWLIIDLAVSAQSIYCAGGQNCDNPGSFATATITGNKIVCNSTVVNCDAAHFSTFFPTATDGGGNVFYATRAAARTANPGVAGLGDCTGVTISVCPLPAPDSLMAVAATMSVGQWKLLTGASHGNIAAAFPTLPTNSTTGCRNRYDASTSFASDATCGTTMVGSDGNAVTGFFAFSKMSFHAGATPQAVMTGAGHGDGFQSDIIKLDLQAAALSIIQTGSGGNWSNLYAGAQYLPLGSANPSWSNFQAGGSSTGLVPTNNVNGQHRLVSEHTYRGLIWHSDVSKWSHSGDFGGCGTGGCTPSTAGGVEVFDETGNTISVFNDVSGGTLNNGFFQKSDSGGAVFNDLDNLIWVWGGHDSGFSLFKFTSPTTAPTRVSVAGVNNGPQNFTVTDAVLIPDPINGSTKRAIFQYCGGSCSTSFELMANIGGTPAEFDSGTFVSVPTFNGCNQAFIRVDALSAIVAWDGGGKLSKITPNNSNPPTNWTWVAGSNTPSGDTPNFTADFCGAEYDPIRNVYYAGGDNGDVLIYKPGANGAP